MKNQKRSARRSVFQLLDFVAKEPGFGLPVLLPLRVELGGPRFAQGIGRASVGQHLVEVGDGCFREGLIVDASGELHDLLNVATEVLRSDDDLSLAVGVTADVERVAGFADLSATERRLKRHGSGESSCKNWMSTRSTSAFQDSK